MILAALFLATVNKVIVDAIAKPLKERFPDMDFWWLFYVALVLGGVIGWFSGVNLFVDHVPQEIVGRLLTAVLIGGGSSLINDLFGGGISALESVGE